MKTKLIVSLLMMCFLGQGLYGITFTVTFNDLSTTEPPYQDYNIDAIGNLDWLAFAQKNPTGAFYTLNGSSYRPAVPGLFAAKSGANAISNWGYELWKNDGQGDGSADQWRTVGTFMPSVSWVDPALGAYTHKDPGNDGSYALGVTPREKGQQLVHLFTVNPSAANVGAEHTLDIWWQAQDSTVRVQYWDGTEWDIIGNVFNTDSGGANDGGWRAVVKFTPDTADPIDFRLFMQNDNHPNETDAKYGIVAMALSVPDPEIPISHLPAYAKELVPVGQVLSWQQDAGIASDVTYDVYFDPNAATFTDTPVVSGTSDLFYTPTLAYNTEYYWRVDAREPNLVSPFVDIIHQGPALWFKTTPAVAVITAQPQGQTVAAGETAVLTVGTSNATTYQWYKNNVAFGSPGTVPVDGVVTLTITDVQVNAGEGVYRCDVDNDLSGTDPVPSDPAVVLTERLVGWWKLDNSLADAVTTPAYNGSSTLTAVFAEGIDGGTTGALSLPGNADSVVSMTNVDDPSNDFYNFHPQGITFSAWVKVDPAVLGTDTRAGLVGKTEYDTEASSSLRGTGLFHYDSGNAGFVMRGSSFSNLNSNTLVCDSTWHLVTGTYDAGTQVARIYIDGELANSATNTNANDAFNLTDQPLRLGFEGLETERYLNGQLDDVRIWSYPLGEVEVAHLYTDFNPGETICLPSQDTAGALAADVSGPSGVPDCKVDIYDFAETVTVWLESTFTPDDWDQPN
jgi:hypothetical protein